MSETMRDTASEMRDLARSVGESLEAEASFSVDDWEPGDDIPSDIEDSLPEPLHTGEWSDDYVEEARAAIQVAYDEWRESVDCLDVRAEVSVYAGQVTTSSVTLVLGTGGPHVEVCLDESGRGEVIAYGWFGADRATYPVAIGGHPLMDIVELTIEQLDVER